MKELTDRQREILTFITRYINAHTYPPTIREIADDFEISIKGAHDHVTALKKKGYVRNDKRSRTLEVIKRDGEEDGGSIEIPILGPVAAGVPILAEENWDGVVPISRSMLKRGSRYFALKVKGDSMEGAGILDGDMAIIEQREVAENGEIVVAMVNDATTLKRYYREKARIRLQPENDNYKPIYSQDVRLLGRVAKIIRSY
ncbi:MAG: transcriptional repressor LexA [Spirochaetaceae bacterium]|jgi:repressor LexA|nr:transcriptional repressor LexA [Spirochaetaceae bacterium]